MPRPKLHSDDAILEAARRVMLREGLADFTLQAVAIEIGISRAALIQRFSNRETLLRHIAVRATEQTRKHLETMISKPGVHGLWLFLCELVSVLGTGEGFANRLPVVWQETRDAEIKRLAHERNRLVHQAIAIRLPTGTKSPEAWAATIHAIIGGAAMQWIYDDRAPLDEYVLRRLKFAMEQMFPGESFALPRLPASRK